MTAMDCQECQQRHGYLPQSDRRYRRNHRTMKHPAKNSRCQAQNQSSNRLVFSNSSIYFLGLLTCAAVIVQAWATPPSPSNLSPWGTTRGGGHVGSKKKKGTGIPSTTASVHAMSENDVEPNRMDSNQEVEIEAEIRSRFIHPSSGMPAINSSKKEETLIASATKTILTSGGFADAIIPASYVAETNLPTDIGHYRIRAYRIEEIESEPRLPHPLGAGAGLGSEPCVIYCTDKPPFGLKGGMKGGGRDVPVRIHDQCVTSEVFRSQR